MAKKQTPEEAAVADETVNKGNAESLGADSTRDALELRDTAGNAAAATQPDQREAIPTRKSTSRFPQISGYSIDQVLGRGGMGIVYQGHNESLQRKVAVKTLLLSRNSGQARQRIEHEARSLAKIQHPGVVQIHDFGTFDDAASEAPTPFIVMELVDGPSLDKFCDGNPVKPRDAAKIVYELAKALQHCHEQGIVHRDIKPGNVLMAGPEEPKLTDFGLARITDQKSRLTKTGEVMGTPAYMAPEQASGVVKNVGPAADIYGLGAILYELLTGRPPFMAPDPVQTMMQVLTEDPPAPRTLQKKLPVDLETIALKCLEKKGRHRYETAGELADDLKRFLRREPISAKRTPVLRKTTMWLKRHPGWSSLIGLAFAGVIAVILGTAFHVNSLNQELERSKRIIDEGRTLSKWLLNDFTGVLESPEGLTYVRSELTDRTQQYLNALLTEAGNDSELKEDIAFSFARLAQLQGQLDSGSLGQEELAAENLKRAQQILDELGDRDTEMQQKVEAMIHIQLAGNAFANGEYETARAAIEKVESIVESAECLLNSGEQTGMKCAVAKMKFDLAETDGDKEAMESTLELLGTLKDKMIQDTETPGMAILSIVEWANASDRFLEPDNRLSELFEVLKTARSQIEELGGDSPDRDVLGNLANIDDKLATAYFKSRNYGKAIKNYKSALRTWESLLERDSSNQIIQFNIGLQYQNVGETLVQIATDSELISNDGYSADAEALLLDAEEAYESAEEYYTLRARQLDLDLSTDEAWLQFKKMRSTLYMLQSDFLNARRSIEESISGLELLAPNNNFHRRALGDALLLAGLIDIQMTVEEMTKWANEEEHNFLEVQRRAVEMFTRAKEHFSAMEEEGMGSEAIRAQMSNAQEMLEHLEYQKSEYFRLGGEEL
ncbi:MAG: serine/threonine-protein kinase [Planctomycetota bacterium]